MRKWITRRKKKWTRKKKSSEKQDKKLVIYINVLCHEIDNGWKTVAFIG
jgi:hypothetical protein